MDLLMVGFKGKNNSSAVLVSALSSRHVLLTNSFEGLRKDIENMPVEHDGALLFGVDKDLVDSVRIESVAGKDGMSRTSKLDLEGLAERFSSVGIRATLFSEPTKYLCNEAYWHLLEKYDGNAALIHVPTIKHLDLIQNIKLVNLSTPK
ncbi:MAG: hypothetical protein IJL09_06785 [Lachnospiraceae bacterium]|nr:hypothetical protein [Lachnospiraceae bacterium]